MKKILSLLSMLMITVTAFATSYTDKLTYKLTVFTALTKDLPAGELTIEPYGTSNYTVTAKGCDLSDFDAGNWDEIVCEDVAGTKDANGVTTITLDNPYAYRTSDNTAFTDTKLVVKFNGTKAYAHFEGKMKVMYVARAFEYTFGTDEGFEGGSTGGGETGGEVKEDYYINFDKSTKNTHASRYSTSVSLQQVGKDKQTISFNSTKDGYEDLTASKFTVEAGSEVTPSIGYVGEWMHGYVYIDLDNNKQFSFNAESDDQTGTDVVSYSFYTTATGEAAANGKNSKGETVASNCNVNPLPSFTAPATPGTYRIRFKVDWNNIDAGGGVAVGQNICANGGGIWDATLEVVAPAPTVDKEVPFTGVAFSVSNGLTGNADVTFKEMSDETVKMTFSGNGYNIALEGLAKGTDAKGRTTYTGEVSNGTTTYTVNAVVYDEGTAQNLYMTMVSADGTKFTVGEDPDYVAPDEPKDETVVEKYQADGTGFSHKINVDWDKQKIVASIDFSNGGDDKDILAMTTGESFTAFQTSTYRTMHWYCNQTAKQMSGFFAKDGAGNNNTGRMDVADCLAKFEISKAEGLKVNGEVKMTPTVLEDLLTGDPIIIGSGESPKFSKAYYNYIKVVSLDWKEPTEPEVTVKEEKTFNEALYMGGTKAADAKVVVKEMSDNTVNMSLQFSGYEYTSTELTKGTDSKGRTTYTGKVAKDTQTYDVAGVVYEKDNVERLYMTMITGVTTVVVGENPDAVTPEVTEVSNKTYTSNLRILDGETTVVEEAEANVNIVKYSDESYKVTLKNVNMLNKTQDLVFVGKALIEEAPTEATEPLTIIAKSDEATTTFFGEEMNGTFEITEVSAEEIKMDFSMESQNFSYQGEFNYTEEETPEVYTNNLHIYDAAAPETDLFQADQAKVEFLATETGEFKLTLKDVTLNEKTQDLVFTGALPTPQPGGQDPLAEEGEGEVTPAEPAMVLNATADEATATFLGTTSATAVFNVIMNDEAETENDAFALTFTITAGEKTLGGEFNYKKKTPDTPDPELFCKENYVADGEGFEWEIAVDWDTQKIVMSIDPSTCTGGCEDVIGLGAVPTAWNNTLHLYRTSADQQLQGYFQTSAGNNNTGKFAETAPFLVEVSKAQGFVVNNEVKIAASAMSDLFTLSTVKMGTGEGANDKSRATYNYVKVVDKDWTAPKDPDTGINATTVAEGEVEFFTVNGVKLNKLQKGLNIVRTADGKVKKVLVK
ncbi:hypothetical protein [Leyella stercorea]|uniref:hypothetical protein n=1 Tax=Leyella stercorea TaxID=363265 RepID=UPI003AEFE233